MTQRLVCWLWCVVLLGPAVAVGQSSWRPIFVPADRQELWPEGDWTPIDGRLIAWEVPKNAPRGFLSEAVYEAEYRPTSSAAEADIGGTLSGELRWKVERPEGTDSFVDLGIPSVAIYQLQQENEPAKWGRGSDGRCRLLSETGASQVAGRWTSRGRLVDAGDAFRLTLPPSLSTRLLLRVPRGLIVQSPRTVVLRVTGNANSPTQLWELRPDRAGPIDIEIRSARRSPLGRSVQFERNIDVVIGEERMRWRVDLAVSLTGVRPRSLPIRIPNDVTIDAVFVGQERVANAKPVTIAGQSLLRLDVPDANEFRLQLSGHSKRQQRGRDLVPDITIPDALALRGGVSVAVTPPLQVESLDGSGYVQVVGDLDSASGDLLEFDQVEQAARLAVTTGPPESTVATTVLTVLDTGQSVVQRTVAVAASASSGATYELTVDWPIDWQLTSVVSDDGGAVESWRVERDESDKPVAKIRLTRAITPSTPQQLVLRGRYGLPRLLDATVFTPVAVNGVVSQPQYIATQGEAGAALRAAPALQSGAVVPCDVNEVGKETPFAELLGSRGDRNLYCVTGRNGVVLSLPDRPSTPGDRTPDASLVEASNSKNRSSIGSSSPQSIAARLDLDLFWTDESERRVRTVATFHFPGSGVSSLPDVLPPAGSRWISARSGEQPIPTVANEGRRQFAPGGRYREITIEYQVSVPPVGLRTAADFELPALAANGVDVPVVATNVRLHLPGSLAFVSSGDLAHTGAGGFEVGLLRRIFGPLGRPIGQSQFRPWSASDWRSLFQGTPSMASNSLRLPVQLFYPIKPDAMELVVSSPGLGLAIAWQLWWTGLALVTAVRSFRPMQWREILVTVLTSIGVISLLVPDEFALPTGGLFCGAVFGLLLPRVVVRRPIRDDEIVTSDCSTSIYPTVTRVTSVILIGLVIAGSHSNSDAQNPVAGGSTVAPAKADRAEGDGVESNRVRDVIVPTTDGAPIARWMDGRVFVQADAAQQLQSNDALRSQLIRSVEANVTRIESGLEVACRFDVVHGPVGSGVFIPLDGEAVLDTDTIAVDSVAVTPLPVAGGVFIPVASAETAVSDVRLAYTISKPIERFGPGESLLALPLAGIPSGTIRVADESLELVAQSVVPAGAGLYRVLPERRPLIVSVQPSTPRDDALSANGSYTETPVSPLVSELTYSVLLPPYLAHQTVTFAFPADVVLAGPAEVSIDLEKQSSQPSMTERRFRSGLWSTVNIGGGLHLASVRFGETPANESVRVAIQGWRRTSGAGVGPLADEVVPKMLIAGQEFSIDWADIDDETDQPADANAVPAGQVVLSDVVAREDLSVERIAHSARITDTTLFWTSQIVINTASNPVFSLPLAVDDRLRLETVDATVNGREARNRWVSKRGQLNVMFDGAVSGEIELSIAGYLDRPRRGRFSFPIVSVEPLLGRNVDGSLSLENRASSPIEIRTGANERFDLWAEPVEFATWPSEGPRSARNIVRPGQPEFRSAIVSFGDDAEWMYLALSSKPALTRRSIGVPEGFRVVDINGEPVESTPSVALTTLADASQASVAMRRDEASNGDVLVIPNVDRVVAQPTWVVIAQSDRRIPVGGEFRSLNELPVWISNRLPADFVGSAYLVDRNPIRLTKQPKQSGPTEVAAAAHSIWRSSNGSIVGMTRWSFPRPGTFQVADSADYSVTAMLIDETATPFKQGSQYVASREATLWWRTASNAEFVPLPRAADRTAASELLFVNPSPDNYSVARGGFMKTLRPVVRDAIAANATDDGSDEFNVDDFKLDDFKLDDLTFETTPEMLDAMLKSDAKVYARLPENQTGEPAVRVHRFRGFSAHLVLLLIAISAIVIAWRVDHRNLWQRLADQLAREPRAVAGVFGLIWWLFLTPSVLGVFIMIVVVWLTLFRPLENREVRIGPAS